MTEEKTYATRGQYSCDGGSLAIYESGTCFQIPNGVGDGEYLWQVVDGDDPEGEFITSVYVGPNTFISSYDCNIKNPKQIAPGRYGIWTHRGNIYFKRWDDEKWK